MPTQRTLNSRHTWHFLWRTNQANQILIPRSTIVLKCIGFPNTKLIQTVWFLVDNGFHRIKCLFNFQSAPADCSRTQNSKVTTESVWLLVMLGSVWYMCLKTENYYLKTFIKIHEVKKCVKIHVMLFKNWKLLFENTNQILP